RGNRGRGAGPLVSEGRGSTLRPLLNHHVVSARRLGRENQSVGRIHREVPDSRSHPTTLASKLLKLLGQPARSNHTSTSRTSREGTVVNLETLTCLDVPVLASRHEVTEEAVLRATSVETRVPVHSSGVAGTN